MVDKKDINPPYSLEAEMAVLGACLYYPKLLNKAVMELSEEDFYDERNKNIFSALKTLSDENPTVDFTLFIDYISKRDLIEKCGGEEYLGRIIDIVNVATGEVLFDKYISIIKDKSIKRSIINAFNEAVRMAYDDNEDAEKILDKVESIIFDIRTRGLRVSDWKSVSDIVRNIHGIIDAKMEGKITSGAIHTGFSEIDNIIGGFQPGEWVILAARPSVGKTAFVLNIHRNLALEGIPTAMFSLEMSAELIVMRLLAMESGIPMRNLKEGIITREHLTNLTRAVENIMEMPIYIDDTGNMDIFELRSKARIAVKEFGVRMISIDYLQLLSLGAAASSRKMSRAEELAKISRSIKSLAKELNITIIGLSQVTREVEKRAEKKPLLSDLRESGALEQDADIVIFLYRPDKDDKNIVAVDVAKNRNGAQGEAKLFFQKEYMRFENLSTGEDYIEEDDEIPI
ncbi:MAG: replicative DNA helicase [candidate division WOR-3 bacterium]